MSRSHRNTPIAPFHQTWPGTMKRFKAECNRKIRHHAKQDMHAGEYDALPENPNEISNELDLPNDGWWWFGDFLNNTGRARSKQFVIDWAEIAKKRMRK